MTKTATPISTPWGPARLVEQLRLPQQAGDKRFASVVELLENDRGERLVRFAYSTDGTTRRGPVTLRERDVARLRKELATKPATAQARGDGFEAEGAETAAASDNRAASTSDPRISAPSAEPSSGSTACSGCGISPKTLPAALSTPATSPTDPFGFAPEAYR